MGSWNGEVQVNLLLRSTFLNMGQKVLYIINTEI